MPVELRIETEGKTESQKIDVVGTDTQYVVDTFGRPRRISVDPGGLGAQNHSRPQVRIAILKGQQFVAQGDLVKRARRIQEGARRPTLSVRWPAIASAKCCLPSATTRPRSMPSATRCAATMSRAWTEVWSHIAIGKIFDFTGQRDRAVNEYRLAVQTNDNTQGAVNEARQYLQKPYKRTEEN